MQRFEAKEQPKSPEVSKKIEEVLPVLEKESKQDINLKEDEANQVNNRGGKKAKKIQQVIQCETEPVQCETEPAQTERNLCSDRDYLQMRTQNEAQKQTIE